MSQLIDLSDYADQDLLSQLQVLAAPYSVETSDGYFTADFLVVRNVRDGILIAYRILDNGWEREEEVVRASLLGELPHLDWCPLDAYVGFSTSPRGLRRLGHEYPSVRANWVRDVNKAVRAHMTDDDFKKIPFNPLIRI